ncbi:MAG TPA: restriction endonuclease [Candidatus Limnocylindria bacterium]|nr:restriction endonuclease [Candidatus Limnocylindria bacterium]
MRARGQRRQLSLDEMSAADAAPRLTLLAAICLGGATCALLLLNAAGPYGILLDPVIRPVAWLGVAGGLVLALAASLAWGRAARDQATDAMTGLTRRDLRELSPERFVDWSAARLREQGYRVTAVGGHSDPGVDLIAERESERLVVQCKRWFGARPVGEPQLGDLYGAMHHEHANGAAVITTGVFSEPALSWAQGKPIQLWDVDRFMGRTPQHTAKATSVPPAERI